MCSTNNLLLSCSELPSTPSIKMNFSCFCTVSINYMFGQSITEQYKNNLTHTLLINSFERGFLHHWIISIYPL